MVWFLEKIFGGEKKEAGRRAITLPALRRWCEDYLAEREGDVARALEAKADEILGLKTEAEEIVQELVEYEFPEDVKKRVYKTVLTHRPVYTRGLREVLSGLGRPDNSIEGYIRFHSNLVNMLMGVQKIQLDHGPYLMVFFRDELPRLGGVLNRIIDLKGEFETVLGDSEQSTGDIRRMIEKVDKIEASLGRLKDLKDEIRAAEKSLGELDERYEKLNRELAEHLGSPRYKEYKNALGALEEKRRKRLEAESQILNLLRPKARVFRKYKKYLEDRGEKDAFLDGYISDPVVAFVREEEGCPHLRRIMIGMEQASRDGGLSLDEKEIHAANIEWEMLEQSKIALAEFEGIADIDEAPENEREKLETEIQKISAEKEKTNKLLADAKKDIKSLKKSAAKGKAELENELARIRKESYSIEPLNLG